MNRKEKVQKIQDIMKMTYNSDVPTFLMLSLIGVVMGLLAITTPLHKPGMEMAPWFGALLISVSVFALMIRLHLLRRSFEKLGENLFDLQYALSRTEMTRFPDLEALSNKFYANIKEKRLLEQQLPADDEDANFAEITEESNF